MSLIETSIVFVIGAAAGALLVYAFLRQRHSGWISLPTGTSLVLSVDADGYGKFWEIKKMLPGGLVRMPDDSGVIQIDPQSGIWLRDAKVKLFLHYADYFRTIPPKAGAFFTHFRNKKQELADEKAWDTVERQAENQPEHGTVFNIRDVMHWVVQVTPAQLLEGVLSAAYQVSGLKDLLLESRSGLGGGLLKWLLIAGLAVGAIFFVLMLFRR